MASRVHGARRMESDLSRALDDLTLPMIALEHAWTASFGREGLGYAFRDAIHHVCVVLAWLPDDVRAPHAGYDHLGETAQALAHEAHLAVVALGLEVFRAGRDRAAPRGIVAAAKWAVDDVLDALAPFVSHTDGTVRAAMLEGVPYELTVELAG